MTQRAIINNGKPVLIDYIPGWSKRTTMRIVVDNTNLNRQNILIAKETMNTIDPSVTELHAKIFAAHKEPKPPRRKPRKRSKRPKGWTPPSKPFDVLRPPFKIPTNTRVVYHETFDHKRWQAMPNALRQAVMEPRHYFMTESDFELPSVSKKNPDLPDNMAFYVMGCQERNNEWLDATPMHDRHFRECCVQTQNGNLFLEPRHGATQHIVKGPDGKLTKITRARLTRGQTFHDPEWISKRLFCPIDLAIKIAKAFIDLEINDWATARRILLGVVFSGKIPTVFEVPAERLNRYKKKSAELAGTRSSKAKGLISYCPASPAGAKVEVHGPSDIRGLAAAVDFLEMLAAELKLVTYEPRPMVNLDLHEDAPGVDDDPFWVNADLGPDEKPFIEDDLDVYGGDSNPFTAHALCGDGSDALPDELVRCMKSATDWNLVNLSKGVRPYWMQDETGRWIPPNRGMSQQQTSHFWDLWHERRAQINAVVNVDPGVNRFIKNLDALEQKRAAAYIYALRDGRRFVDRGVELHPEGIRVIPTALKVLWARYNERFTKRTEQVA